MLEGYFLDLGWLLGALFFGVGLGSLTGLIPGFHVNNVALILLALSPALLDLGIPLSAVAAIIVSTGTVHTFLNYIPSALIGAPDGDTALSLLPGHRMLLSGNAARGVAWSARGSQLGLFLSLPLIILARIAFGPELGWYDGLKSVLPFVLLSVSLLLLATETTRLDWPLWMQNLTRGRFGRDSRLAGFLTSQATVLVMGGRNLAAKAQGKQGYGMDWETRRLTELSDDELLEIAKAEAEEGVEGPQTKQDLEIIAILSAVNTAVTVMVLGFLYIISRSRSGATLALKMMYPIETWSALEPTSDFIRLLAVTLAAGLLAMPMMRYVGMGMLRLHAAIPLQQMVMGVILFVVALVWLSTGFVGIGVLIVGTIIGLLPPRIGIRRSHGMGIILVPIMIYTFAQKFDSFGFI